MFDNTYLSKVVEDIKLLFTQMEVLDLYYHQFFFPANSQLSQHTTSQFVQPLSPSTVEVSPPTFHYAISEHTTTLLPTVTFSQDEYQCIFCSF